MSSNHEQALHGKRLGPAVELAFPGGDAAGLALTAMDLSAHNSSTGQDVTYVMYDHHATGMRGYSRRFTQQPRSDNSSSLFAGNEQYLELELPASLMGVIKQIRCELNCTFTDGTVGAGSDSATVLPSDQWISRIEVRGGGSAGSVLETIRGDVMHLERPYRLSEVESKLSARDMLWGENDADLYLPSFSVATGTQASAPAARRYQIDLITPITDSQIYAPSLNLSQHPLTIRVYFRGTVFSQDQNGTAGSVSVSAARFWIEEHVLNEADAVAAAQVLNDHPMVYRCLSRQEFIRSKGTLSDSTEYNDLLQNLYGLSAALMVYVKEDRETVQTSPSASSPEGELAHFHQLSVFRLLDRTNGPIIEEETDEINRLSTQREHLSLPIWYNDTATMWYHYLIPFCDDFGAALHGTHTGARALTGSETLYYTTTAVAPDAAASLHVVSYDYASWVCRRGAPPQFLIARIGA